MLSCTGKKDKNNKSTGGVNQIVDYYFPEEGVKGGILKLMIGYGKNTEEIPVTVKISSLGMVMVFSNSFLSGSEIRSGSTGISFIDLSTRKTDLFSLTKQPDLYGSDGQWKIINFNGKSRKTETDYILTTWEVQLKRKSEVKFSKLEVKNFREQMPGYLEKIIWKLVFSPWGENVPPTLHEKFLPREWKWITENPDGVSEISVRLIDMKEKLLMREEIYPFISSFKKVKLSQIAEGYSRHAQWMKGSVVLKSRRKSALVFVNGKLQEFLVPGLKLYFPVDKGPLKIFVQQIWGTQKLLERTFISPVRWEI